MKNKKLQKMYGRYKEMKYRCSNKNCKFYKYYGGRGIKVCKRWLDKKKGFLNFLKDMGLPPTQKHSLDRIDVNGDYKPSNCRWATWKEQAYNKRKLSGTSKYKGISRKIKNWNANLFLGCFDSERKAFNFREKVKQILELNGIILEKGSL